MALKLILAQVREVPADGRKTVQIRGVFSQKKKLWDIAILPQFPVQEGFAFYDDVTQKTKDMAYGNLCNMLTATGRLVILDRDGNRVAQMWSAVENDLRKWDTDENGVPIVNAIAKESAGDE